MTNAAGARPASTPRVAAASTWALAAVFTLREARPLLAPAPIAVLLTFVLAPGVRSLRYRGSPEFSGALLLLVALLASTVPLAATLARSAAQ